MPYASTTASSIFDVATADGNAARTQVVAQLEHARERRHVLVVDAVVELAVDVEQLLRALLVEHAHLLEQRTPDALAQLLLGQLAAEHGRERVAVRGDDQRHRVDQRAVEVEDDGRVAHTGPEQRAERRQRILGEEVEAQRRERDVALRDGGDVGARLAVEPQRRLP